MSRMLRAALALGFALVGFGFVVGASSPAYACPCKPSTVREDFKAADAVFVATPVAIIERGVNSVTYDVRARTSYKVDVDVDFETQVITPSGGAACGLEDVEVGEEYVFFARNEVAPFEAELCGGSAPVTTALVEKLDGIASPTTVEVPSPPPPTLTDVDITDPTGFARLAAPGAAVAIVGLLALLVVGRFARR